MKLFNIKITYIFLIFMVVFCYDIMYAKPIINVENSVDNIVDNNQDILFANFPNKNLKMILSKDGRELVKINGQYSELGRIYNIKNNKLEYLYSNKYAYFKDNYEYAGHWRMAKEDLKIYTLDGIYLGTIDERETYRRFTPLFKYSDFIFYLDEGHDLNVLKEKEHEDGNWDSYRCLLNAYDVINKKNICIYDTSPQAIYRYDFFEYNNSIIMITSCYGDHNNVIRNIIFFDENQNIKTASYKYDMFTFDFDKLKNSLIDMMFDDNFVSFVDAVELNSDDNDDFKIVSKKENNTSSKNGVETISKIKYNDKDYFYMISEINRKNNYYDVSPSECYVDIYDTNSNLIAKNINLCDKGKKIYYCVDYGGDEFYPIYEYEKEDKIEGLWKTKQIVNLYLQNNCFYYIKKNNFYDLYMIDGTLIEEGIEDYIIDASGLHKAHAIYKKNNDWFMIDEYKNIIAKGFDVESPLSVININGREYLIASKDSERYIFDKDGAIINFYHYNYYGSTAEYMIVDNAFNYGLMDVKGNWFYKKSMFDTLDMD